MYSDAVLKILRHATYFLLFASFVSPVAELFDRWDPPGLGSDTDMPLFAFVLLLSLVLLVCRLLASVANTVTLVATLNPAAAQASPQLVFLSMASGLSQSAFCTASPPLRI